MLESWWKSVNTLAETVVCLQFSQFLDVLQISSMKRCLTFPSPCLNTYNYRSRRIQVAHCRFEFSFLFFILQYITVVRTTMHACVCLANPHTPMATSKTDPSTPPILCRNKAGMVGYLNKVTPSSPVHICLLYYSILPQSLMKKTLGSNIWPVLQDSDMFLPQDLHWSGFFILTYCMAFT